MELKIKTVKGSCVLSDVSDTMTVGELKALLHQQHKDDQLAVPAADQHRLVFKQTVLPPDMLLQQAGITSGDQLVLLAPKKAQSPPLAQTTPAPDAVAIRTAITEEARRRGIEHTLREERPPVPAARRNMLLTPEMLGSVDSELLNLLEQALGAGAGAAAGPLLQGLQGLRLGLAGQGAQEGEEEEEEEVEGEIQAPEPAASHVAQLTDMGFAEPLARKALVLTRDNVELALEWILQHMDEPNAADPPTQEQLRQIYGRRRRRRVAGPAAAAAAAAAAVPPAAAAAVGQGAAAEAVLSQLTDMGFDAASAQQALARVGPNLDLAVSVLLGQGLQTGPPLTAGGRSSDTAAAAAAAADATGQGGSSNRAAEAGSSIEVAAAAAAAREEYGSSVPADPPGAGSPVQGLVGSSSYATAEGQPEDEDGEAAEMADEEEEEEEEDTDEYEDAAEDEYLDYDDEDEEGEQLPLHLEQALGTMGSMDLNELGSADMEQLLQGAAIQDLVGNHLLMAGGMDAGMGAMGGGQGALLRLMEAPGLLQQLMAAVAPTATAAAVQGEQQSGGQQQAEDQDEGAPAEGAGDAS